MQEIRTQPLKSEIKWTLIVSLLFHFLIFVFFIFFSKRTTQKKIVAPTSTVTVVKLVKPKIEKKKKRRIIKVKKKPKRKKIKKKPKRKKIKKKPKKKKIKKKNKVIKPKKDIKKNENDDIIKKIEALEREWIKKDSKLLVEKERVWDEQTNAEVELAEKLKSIQKKWLAEKKKISNETQIEQSKKVSTIKLDSPNIPTEYLLFIQNGINENWKLPLIQQNFNDKKIVIVFFKIYRDGDIGNVSVETSSGISNLDKSALNAVLETRYLSPLPENFSETFLGVHYRFEYSYEN